VPGNSSASTSPDGARDVFICPARLGVRAFQCSSSRRRSWKTAAENWLFEVNRDGVLVRLLDVFS
jgi:hypothetical protein